MARYFFPFESYCPVHVGNRFSKWPRISRQTTARHEAFSRIRLNIPASTFVTTATSAVLWGTAQTFSCRKTSTGDRSGDRGDHKTGPRRPGYFAFSHYHFPHNDLEVRRAEATASASQLEWRLRPAPVQQFSENCDIAEQSTCQVAHRGPRQCRRRFPPKRRRWSELLAYVRE
jgi:hypothetical protein